MGAAKSLFDDVEVLLAVREAPGVHGLWLIVFFLSCSDCFRRFNEITALWAMELCDAVLSCVFHKTNFLGN